MSEIMDDTTYIEQVINTVTDPYRLLELFVEHEHMLRGDGYYKDFHQALFDKTRQLLRFRNR